jgi:rubrerythrin
MDIYEFGMQMEKDGEKFYRDLAETCGDKGLAVILNMMADTEVKHYEVLKQMKAQSDPSLSQTELLNDVKNVFVQMKDDDRALDLNVSQIDLYKKAQEIEKKSEEFYLAKAGEVTALPHKDAFKMLADEEKLHYNLLGSLIDFVSRPDNWLENAEWNNFDQF